MRRARRRPAIPSAAVRRAKTPTLPRGVELFYLLVLGKRANRFAAACRKVLTPGRIAKFAKPEKVHTDAGEEEDDDALRAIMHELREATAKAAESDKFLIDTNTAAKRVVKHSQSEFDRLGITISEGEPDLSDMIDEWRAGCVDRITSVEADQLEKIRNLLREGDGHRVETLADELEWQIEDVSSSRAELIARDQTLKLNSLVTKERHAAAGIESYVWTTSNDERVRETHEALEGQEFRWDDPPEVNDDGDTGHPGEDFQCRCIAFPVLPELDEEAPAEDDEPADVAAEEE